MNIDDKNKGSVGRLDGVDDSTSTQSPAPQPVQQTEEVQPAAQPVAPEPTAEQKDGDGVAESKPTPGTDQQHPADAAKAADNPPGVSPYNKPIVEGDKQLGQLASMAHAENPDVMGYDMQIKMLKDAAARYKTESDADRLKREKKEKRDKMWAAIGDGLMSLSNLYFTTRGAPNMYNHQTMSQQTPLEKRLKEAKAERDADGDKYLNYSLKIGDLNNAKAKTLREIEAQRENQRLAKEKAQREQEEHGWKAELQEDKKREQKGKADKAESDAVTAGEEAKYAPKMQEAKLNTEVARGKAQTASAANSYASAAAHNRQNPNEFSAWDKSGREHKFRTQAAADNFAKQQGTYKKVDSTTTSTRGGVATRNGKPIQQRDKDGNPVYDKDGNPVYVRTSSTTTTTKDGGYPERPADEDNTPPSRRKSNDNKPPSRR